MFVISGCAAGASPLPLSLLIFSFLANDLMYASVELSVRLYRHPPTTGGDALEAADADAKRPLATGHDLNVSGGLVVLTAYVAFHVALAGSSNSSCSNLPRPYLSSRASKPQLHGFFFHHRHSSKCTP